MIQPSKPVPRWWQRATGWLLIVVAVAMAFASALPTRDLLHSDTVTRAQALTLQVLATLIALVPALAGLRLIRGEHWLERSPRGKRGTTQASEQGPRRAVVTAPAVTGSPVDVKLRADDTEIHLWNRDSATPLAEGSNETPVLPLDLGIAWSADGAVTVRITVDKPENFNELVEPLWSPVNSPTELILCTCDKEIVARVPVPGGFGKLHRTVRRKGVHPRVLIYLAP